MGKCDAVLARSVAGRPKFRRFQPGNARIVQAAEPTIAPPITAEVLLPANSSSGGGWRQLVARDESQRRQWQVGAAVFLLSTGNNELDEWVAPRRGRQLLASLRW